MRLPNTRRTPIDAQAAMTPLIDVVFQLLIFFMCASTGHLRELLLPTDFAAGASGQATASQIEKPLGEVWIRLSRSESETIFRAEGQEFHSLVELEAFLQKLVSAARDIPVILDIHGDVPLGDAIGTYDACRAADFLRISFAAKKKSDAAQKPEASSSTGN